jgi:hypothetical protein
MVRIVPIVGDMGRFTANVVRRCHSFVPGTQVALADGTYKPIEEVVVGDEVLATDPETGETRAEPVTALMTSKGDKHLVQISIDNGDAGSTVIATDHHPFWIPELRRWLHASDLAPGMWLRTSAGTHVQIKAIKKWTAVQRVHNMTVADLHTYYVLAGTTPVLVHNSNCSNVLANADGFDNLSVLAAHEEGAVFSGVFDSITGTFRAHLNVELRGPNSPTNAVNRTGGHGEINFLHFNGSRNTIGFTIFKEGDGLSVGWLSRGVNGRNHGAPMAPPGERQRIMEVLAKATGLPVRSR